MMWGFFPFLFFFLLQALIWVGFGFSGSENGVWNGWGCSEMGGGVGRDCVTRIVRDACWKGLGGGLLLSGG
jgi:hypothetical protein